jgi:tetratricopeptide (TPR) repeat protein
VRLPGVSMHSRLELISKGLMEACWLAAAAVIPLFFSLSSIQIFEPDKIAVLRFLALLSGAAWLWARIGLARSRRTAPWHSFLRNPLVKPVLSFALIFLLSSLFALVPSLSWWGLYKRAQGTISFFSYVVLFVVVVTELRRQVQLQRLQFVLVLTSIPVAAYPILQQIGLDPLPQSQMLIGRSSGTLGNPIFLGGYLVMIIPLTICLMMEVVKRKCDFERRPWLILIGGFSVALLLQFVALACTNSRGPVLGLAASGYVIAFVLFVLKKAPRQKSVIIPLAAVGLAFVAPLLVLGVGRLLFKSPAGIVLPGLALAIIAAGVIYSLFYRSASGRGWFWLTWLVQPVALILVFAAVPSAKISSFVPPALGRFSELSGGSIEVRTSLWQSAIQYLRAGPPAVFPEGTRDPYHSLRLAIGYGPECAWLPANLYAVPSLSKIQPTQTADRLHNETFDNLLTIGIAGAAAFLIVVGAGIFYSLRILGFALSGSGKKAFLFLSALGAFAGIAFPWIAGASYIAGIGVELGLLLGVLFFITWSGLRQPHEPFESSPHQLLALGLLGGLIAHLIETSVAIPVTPTRMYFYLFLALISVLSVRDLKPQEAPSKAKHSKIATAPSNWPSSSAFGTGSMVLALSWCFSFNATKEQSFWKVLARSWFSGEGGSFPIPIALLLVVLTIVGSLIFMLAEKPNLRESRSALRKRLVLSGAFLSGFWVVMSAVTAVFWTASGSSSPIEISLEAESRFTIFVILLFIFFIFGALALSAREASPGEASVRIPELVLAIGLFACAAIGVYQLTLRPAWADIDCRIANFYEDTGDPASAARVFERASLLVPRESTYRVSLGSAQNEAGILGSGQMSKAAESFRQAFDLDPLDPGVCRAIGTFHMRAAEQASDPAVRTAEIQNALSYLKRASLLAPNFPDAYSEMGRCYFLTGEDEKANALYQRSLEISPGYWRTHMFLGEMHYRRKNYEEALQDFRRAAKGGSRNIEARKNVGFLLALLGRKEEAIQENLDTLKRAPEDSMLLTRLAVLYFGQGDYDKGMEFAQRAYDAAPAPRKGSRDEFIEQLKLQGK